MQLVRRLRRGFTVLELLVVVAVIGILTALILEGVEYGRKLARMNAAKAQIHAIEAACANFLLDTGNYPADMCECYTSDISVYYLTGGIPPNANTMGNFASYLYSLSSVGPNSPYLKYSQKDVAQQSQGLAFWIANKILLLDPWRVPYVYILAPPRPNPSNPLDQYAVFPGNQARFNLWSLGPNRICESCAFGGVPGAMPWKGPHSSTPVSYTATWTTDVFLGCQKHCGGAKPHGDDLCNW